MYKTRFIETAYYYYWGSLINPHNRKYLDAVSFLEGGGHLEKYRQAFQFAVRNRNDPMLIFLYSVHTDHTGHQHGWMSPKYIRALEAADQAIGLQVGYQLSDGLYDDTPFRLIADHGGKTAALHPRK